MSKRIKYLEINLIKEVKYLYTEGNKTLMEQIEKTQIKRCPKYMDWKKSYCSNIHTAQSDLQT